MKLFNCFYCCTLYIMAGFPSFSQDMIYFSKDARLCNITAISAASINFEPSSGKRNPAKVNTTAALLLFNKHGDFLVPSKLDFASEKDKAKIDSFLSGEKKAMRHSDEIYTINETKIEADIVKQDNKFIYLPARDPSKIDKRQVAAIIYKNGLHSIYNTLAIAKVANILWINNPEKELPQNTPAVHTVAHTNNDTPSIKKTGVLAQDSISTAPDTAGTPVEEKKLITFEELTGNVSQKAFEEKAVKKTKDLNSYLKILCTKSYGYEEHNKALDQAIHLFINEDAAVQVSSITHDEIKSYRIRQYLLRLKSLNYDRVEVEWTNVQYVDKLKKGVDGNYYGTVTLEQVFRGFRDGKIVYEDVTKKSATVVLKAYEKNIEGSTTAMWDVMLSDIGVVYTKSQAQSL